MPNTLNGDDLYPVIHCVHHTVIPNPDSIRVLSAL
jgi:hypothetical protein